MVYEACFRHQLVSTGFKLKYAPENVYTMYGKRTIENSQ